MSGAVRHQDEDVTAITTGGTGGHRVDKETGHRSGHSPVSRDPGLSYKDGYTDRRYGRHSERKRKRVNRKADRLKLRLC